MKSLLLIVVLFLMTQEGYGEFSCTSEVSYKWKKGETEESIIHWASLSGEGKNEPSARNLLNERVLREKKKASEICKDLHENMSGCLGAKFTSSAAELKGLDFAARKALQDAIQFDCKSQQGRCLEITASEVKCSEPKPPEDSAGQKKDEKGKEKKK